MDYTKLTIDDEVKVIRRNADNAFIPLDPNNLDYQTYLEWDVDNDADEEAI